MSPSKFQTFLIVSNFPRSYSLSRWETHEVTRMSCLWGIGYVIKNCKSPQYYEEDCSSRPLFVFKVYMRLKQVVITLVSIYFDIPQLGITTKTNL